MSKVGKMPIKIPEGVNVSLSGKKIKINGPKGELIKEIPDSILVSEKESEIVVVPKRKSLFAKAMHGTYRAIIANMVKGVTEGWEKTLEMVGTGYRAQVSDGKLVITIGFSHPVEIEAPDGINFEVQKTQIKVSGIDKELVGQISAKIRDIRKPEPYKGKGIKYEGEQIRRKPGKAAKAQGVGA